MRNIEVKINATFHEQLKDNGKWQKSNDPAYLEYRRKWNQYPQKHIVDAAPIHLDIETSSICNLRCPMCNYTIEHEKGANDSISHGLMSWELFQKIIDEASEIGVSSVKLNWRGEPTMHKQLADMVKYAKEKGIIDVMLNTNAVNLNEQLSHRLIDAGLDQIFFSVDSIIPEKYAQIRVGAQFEKVLNNIKTFVAYNDAVGHPVFTRVQKVLLNDTKDENEAFKAFWSNIVDQIAFEDYIPYGGRDLGQTVERDEITYYSCPQLWQRMLITWDGEYRVCCISNNIPYIVGNLKNESIAELWHSPKVNELRQLHAKGEWYKCELCKQCYLPYM